MERKLKNERDTRTQLESQLKESKKKSSLESLPDSKVVINHDTCNARNTELESELNRLQSKLDEATQTVDELTKKAANRKTSDTADHEKMKKDIEILTNALNAMQRKNMHLETSLSSETRLKLDLFSALGDTRRQLEITQERAKERCKEVEMLKGKIAEVMAVMPPQYHSSIGSFGVVGGGESKSSFVVKSSVGQDTAVTPVSYSSPITNNGIA